MAAYVVPTLTGWDVHVKTGHRPNLFPPLHAQLDLRAGPGTVPAVLLAVLAGYGAVRWAEHAPWRLLLPATYLAGAAWAFCLVLVDGPEGLDELGSRFEYLQTARATDDLSATLQSFVDRIPLDSPDNWPVHVAGHPPGALVFFVGLARLGLGSDVAAGTVVTLIAASTAVAVLVTLRVLGAETAARRAAPFLVFGPAALWQAVSADAMFAAVAAWGLAALSVATVRRSVLWGGVAGALLGYCVMLSYGLPLLALLAITVLALGGSARPLVSAVPAAAPSSAHSWSPASTGSRHCPCSASGTGTASRPTGPRRTGSGGTWPPSSTRQGRWLPPGSPTSPGVPRLAEPGRRSRVRSLGQRAARGPVTDEQGRGRADLAPVRALGPVAVALLPERWRRAGLALQLVVALVLQHALNTVW